MYSIIIIIVIIVIMIMIFFSLSSFIRYLLVCVISKWINMWNKRSALSSKCRMWNEMKIHRRTIFYRRKINKLIRLHLCPKLFRFTSFFDRWTNKNYRNFAYVQYITFHNSMFLFLSLLTNWILAFYNWTKNGHRFSIEF